VTTDTCVPISRLAEIMNASVLDVEATGLPYFVVGHVGDGNFHVGYLIDPQIPSERETAETLSQRMVEHALRLEGTCTGEHGIGLHKQAFLIEEAGVGAVAVMRLLKQALDPHNIMNPGKIFEL
jgi:D-lactate dehydrogenase (cytochrome)